MGHWHLASHKLLIKFKKIRRSRLDTYRDLAGLLVSGELAGAQSGEFLKFFGQLPRK